MAPPKKEEVKAEITPEEMMYGYIPPELCDFCQKKNEPEEIDAGKIDEITKEKYLVQIRELESRTNRMAERLDVLVARASLYPPRLRQVAEDTQDMVEYLTRNIEQTEVECNEALIEKERLSLELQTMNSLHAEAEREARSKLVNLVHEYTVKIHHIESEINSLHSEEEDMKQVGNRLGVIDVEFERKTSEHAVAMYERGKDIVREELQIRARIPDWVKNVTTENKELAMRKLRYLINCYRLETVHLLNAYIGAPNMAAKMAAEQNASLTTELAAMRRNIEVMQENVRMLTKENDDTVLAIRTAAIDVKKNRELIKSFLESPENNPKITEQLKINVNNCRKKRDKALKAQMEKRLMLEQTDSKTEYLDKDSIVLQAVLASCQESLHQVLDVNIHGALLKEIDTLCCMNIVEDEKRISYTKLIPCDPLSYQIHYRLPVNRPSSR